jgi:aspartyl-tRNA(Asn)/glutamyl-tRNA(Gln) amidotransferase subunit B
MTYEPVIGLEIHAQLKTFSKMFCGCSTKFEQEPNSSTCPICLGLPGVLPVANKKAIAYGISTALALNCNIALRSIFARKNYFYPDLPKGYQISQYEQPLAQNGFVNIETEYGQRKIGIHRLHLEEDAGKLLHQGSKDQNISWVDFNRTGIPLMEIVTEPDISSAEEARAFMFKLRDILAYLKVCDCNMEEGSLRCDANISVRRVGDSRLGVKTEVKNMNSFRFLKRALEYEIKRQIAELESGGRIFQETRLWDEARGVTLSMRSKEEAHDYRYFPEPDLIPVVVEKEWVNQLAEILPELPDEKRARFMEQYQIPAYDTEVLTSSRELAEYFEACVKLFSEPKLISNWIMGELLRELKTAGTDIQLCPVSPENLVQMLKLIQQGVISGKLAKQVFEEMYRTGASADTIVKAKGLKQITDQDQLKSIIDQVIKENPGPVAAYCQGKEKSIGFLIGQVMKQSRGKANPQLVNSLLTEKLKAKG